MKNLLLLLSVLVTFSACQPKEKDDVKPKTLASEVAGAYELTSLKYQDENGNYQYPGLPVVEKGKKTEYGTVTLIETTDPDQITMGVNFNLPTADLVGEEDEFLPDLDIKKNGSRYDLLYSGTKVATINGNTLSLDIETDDFRIVFTADK